MNRSLGALLLENHDKKPNVAARAKERRYTEEADGKGSEVSRVDKFNATLELLQSSSFNRISRQSSTSVTGKPSISFPDQRCSKLAVLRPIPQIGQVLKMNPVGEIGSSNKKAVDLHAGAELKGHLKVKIRLVHEKTK
ncbi:hypothetical protein quinque_014011 [Culex quinquefasciatus]